MSFRVAAAIALAAAAAQAEAPRRIIEVASFHVPAAKLGQVPAAQQRLYQSLSKYPGFIEGRSFQSVGDPTSFLDYAVWDTLEHSEGAEQQAFKDPEIAASYFTLMDRVPFYGHSAALDDSAACSQPALADGEVLALNIVAAKREQSAQMAEAGPAFMAAQRTAAHAKYSEVSRFVEYPEFFLTFAQYPSVEAAKSAPRMLAGEKSAARFFGSVGMVPVSDLFKQVRAAAPRCSRPQ